MSASKFQVTVFTRPVESKLAKIIPLDRIKRITTYFATDTIGQLKYMNSVPQRMSGSHATNSPLSRKILPFLLPKKDSM